MLAMIPLTLIPLIAYNAIVLLAHAGDAGAAWSTTILTVPMLSGALFSTTSGDLMVVAAIVLLFFEILKATRTGAASLADHMLSMLCFVAYLVEFLIVGAAAHSVFAILTVIAFIDVVAGFSITIRGARRDVGFSD